jgi:SAM-dependent methyltransferase
MNLLHHWFCNSASWRDTLKTRFPWSIEHLSLGSRVLEIGPGFGLTTELLLPLAGSLTCVEIDRELANRLQRRFSDTALRVLCEDATATSLPDASFDSVVCFTMLHHLPSIEMQDRLLRQAARVLRPGGTFAGSDSLPTWSFRLLHLFDTMVTVDARTLPERLQAAGFADIDIQVQPSAFRFRARKPVAGQLSAAITGDADYVCC